MPDHGGPDEPVRNLDFMPQLAQELLRLGDELERDMAPPSIRKNGDRLLITMRTAAHFLTEAHKFIASAPEVMQQAKLASLFDGYRSAAEMLRGMARDVEAGKASGLLRPQTLLLRAADLLDSTVAENRPPDMPQRPKPKLVIN